MIAARTSCSILLPPLVAQPFRTPFYETPVTRPTESSREPRARMWDRDQTSRFQRMSCVSPSCSTTGEQRVGMKMRGDGQHGHDATHCIGGSYPVLRTAGCSWSSCKYLSSTSIGSALDHTSTLENVRCRVITESCLPFKNMCTEANLQVHLQSYVAAVSKLEHVPHLADHVLKRNHLVA